MWNTKIHPFLVEIEDNRPVTTSSIRQVSVSLFKLIWCA